MSILDIGKGILDTAKGIGKAVGGVAETVYEGSKDTPVVGGVIGTGEVIFGDKKTEDEVYEKLVRMIAAGKIVSSTVGSGLKAAGLKEADKVLNEAAIKNGALKAAVNNLSHEEAVAVWAILLPLPT